MKALILSLTFTAFFGIAMAQQQPEQKKYPKQEDVKVTLKSDDLPPKIKAHLSSDEYKDFKITSTSYIRQQFGGYYQVVIKKGNEEKTLKLSKEGSPVEQ